MSDATIKVQTTNQLFTDYDVSKFLLGFNSFTEADLTASGADVVLTQGTIMGMISATGKIVPMASAATDGSALPYGVCIVDQTVVDGTTATIKLVNKGRIPSSKLVFQGADTINTEVGPVSYKKTYNALLNEIGLILEDSIEMTAADNS